jgi:hypothetical protein
VRACAPESEPVRSRSSCKHLEAVRVRAPAALVEVGRGGTESDEAEVHVKAVLDSHDVAQETSVLVDTVGRWLGEQPHAGADW